MAAILILAVAESNLQSVRGRSVRADVQGSRSELVHTSRLGQKYYFLQGLEGELHRIVAFKFFVLDSSLKQLIEARHCRLVRF